MNTEQEILEKLASASLTSEELGYWESILKDINGDAQQDILNLLLTDSKIIPILTKSLVSKIEAVQERNLTKWEHALQQDLLTINSF